MLKKVSLKYIFCYLFVLNFTLLGEGIEKIDSIRNQKKLLKLSILDFYNFTSSAHYQYLSSTLLEGVTVKFDKIFSYQKISIKKESEGIKKNITEFIKKSRGNKIQVYNQYLEGAIKSLAKVNNIDIIIFGYYKLENNNTITIITKVYSHTLDRFYELDAVTNPIDATLFSVAIDVAVDIVSYIKFLFHLEENKHTDPVILFSSVKHSYKEKYDTILTEINEFKKYITSKTDLFALNLQEFYVYIKQAKVPIHAKAISEVNILHISQQCKSCTFMVYNYHKHHYELKIYHNGKCVVYRYTSGNKLAYTTLIKLLNIYKNKTRYSLTLDNSIIKQKVALPPVGSLKQKEDPNANIFYDNSVSVGTSSYWVNTSMYLGYTLTFTNRFTIGSLVSPQNKAQKILKNMHFGFSLGALFLPKLTYSYVDSNTRINIHLSGDIIVGQLKLNYGYRFWVHNWFFY